MITVPAYSSPVQDSRSSNDYKRACKNGDDMFVQLLIGFGKSICYQVLPFLLDYTWELLS